MSGDQFSRDFYGGGYRRNGGGGRDDWRLKAYLRLAQNFKNFLEMKERQDIESSKYLSPWTVIVTFLLVVLIVYFLKYS